MTDPAQDAMAAPSADQESAKLAATLAAENEARAAALQPPIAERRSGGAHRAAFASLALLLAVIAVMVAGMLWWQYREFYVSLDETDTAAAAALERVRAEQRALSDALAAANDELAALREQNAALRDRLDALPGRFGALEERLDTVQGGSFDARGNLLRSEAEYYLLVANTELKLAGNFETATTALELADSRLAEIASPELASVREAIAGELLALKSLRLPDIEGIVFSLGRLAARAGELPLRADSSLRLAGDAGEGLDVEPGFMRLWAAVKRTLLALVRVERRDAPVPQVLSAVERALSRRQLEIELELARVAALRGDEQAFRSGLDTAIALLDRDFDGAAADVEGARMLLAELRGFDVAPERPDIARSLLLLRGLRADSR
jgi:uncharacterized protein HemX